MKNTVKRIACILTAAAISLAGTFAAVPSKCSAQVEAASKVSYETIDKSQSFTGEKSTIEVKYYYKYAVLKGSSKAIKKINKTLRDCAKKVEENDSEVFEYAKGDADFREDAETYYDCTEQMVTFYSSKVVSVATEYVWYAGGVSNVFLSGLTFDLKTGKLIKDVTKVTKEKSIAKIRKALKKKIDAHEGGYDSSEIAKKGKTDFEFYVNKKGNVVFCFGPYELGYGGWTKEFTLKGDCK